MAGGDEVDEEEGAEVGEQLFEVCCAGGFGMVVAVEREVDAPGEEHEIDEGRDERQEHLEDEDVGQREEAHGAVTQESAAMFEDGLQSSEGPAEALAHEAVGVDGSLSEGERAVFVDDLVFLLEQVHGEVGIFCDGVDGVAPAGENGSSAPCADGAGNDHDDVEEIECAAFEVLTGDVFESLPACPEIDAIADFGVSGDGADLRDLRSAASAWRSRPWR